MDGGWVGVIDDSFRTSFTCCARTRAEGDCPRVAVVDAFVCFLLRTYFCLLFEDAILELIPLSTIQALTLLRVENSNRRVPTLVGPTPSFA